MNIHLKKILTIGVFITVAAFVLSAVVLPAVALGAGADSSQSRTDEPGTPPDKVSSPAKEEQQKDVSSSTDDIEYDDSYDDDDDEWEG